MNRITRMLMVGGLGLVAGVTFGVGPAAAATASDSGASTASQNSDRRFGNDDRRFGNDDRRFGNDDRRFDNDRRHFRGGFRHHGDDRYGPFTYRQCQWIGEEGEDRGYWDEDEWDCDPGRRGWYLEIDRDRDWNWHGSSRGDWYRLRLAGHIVRNIFN